MYIYKKTELIYNVFMNTINAFYNLNNTIGLLL